MSSDSGRELVTEGASVVTVTSAMRMRVSSAAGTVANSVLGPTRRVGRGSPSRRTTLVACRPEA